MPDSNSFEQFLNAVIVGNNQPDWGTLTSANLTLLAAQAALGSLAIAAQDMDDETLEPTSLTVKLSAGVFANAADTAVVVAATTLTLSSSNDHYIWLTDAGVLTQSTSAFPTGSAVVRLAIVTTGPSIITSIVDARVPWRSVTY